MTRTDYPGYRIERMLQDGCQRGLLTFDQAADIWDTYKAIMDGYIEDSPLCFRSPSGCTAFMPRAWRPSKPASPG